MTSGARSAKTRLCKDCRSYKPVEEFPRDKYLRADTRMCLQCIDENAPLLMTENEMAKWLGVTIAEVRAMTPAGDYSPPKGATIPLYGRQPVSIDYLPTGWRTVFDWAVA